MSLSEAFRLLNCWQLPCEELVIFGRNAVILSKAYRSASQRTFAEAEVAGLRPLALRDQGNVLWDHVVSLADGRGNERQWCRRSSFGLGSHLASDANSQVQRIMFAVSGLHISIEIVSSGGKDNSGIVNAQEEKKMSVPHNLTPHYHYKNTSP